MIKRETKTLINYKQSHFLNARHALNVGYSMSLIVVKLFYKQIITNINKDDNIRKNKPHTRTLTTHLI